MPYARPTSISFWLTAWLSKVNSFTLNTVFEECGQFIQALSRSKDDLKLLCNAMIGDFCRVYESCGSGKDKYTRFVYTTVASTL